jgi:hypothetical protein
MVSNELQWSQEVFGSCALGDPRRTRRLVDVGSRMARRVGSSMARCCAGSAAALLGSYRLMRNAQVDVEAIREGGLTSVAQTAREQCGVLIALEDTTSISYAHAASAELGATGSQRDAKQRGFLVHSILLLAANGDRTLGLIEQRHWIREKAKFGQKHARKQRGYEDKESFKWEQASRRMAERLGAAMSRTISVCDRESDVYHYLAYKLDHDQRFVLRARADRCIEQSTQHLFDTMEKDAQTLCEYTVAVSQRGGRRAREARLSLRSLRVDLKAPATYAGAQTLSVNVVLASEANPPEGVEALRWVLLTTEPIDDADQARTVMRYYELRWRIEDYHKAWKSGVGVERQRFQSSENLERMLVITAFLAVRLLQLREHLQPPEGQSKEESCEPALSREEWQLLWLSREHTPLPKSAPSLRWACLALARLGGFTDTKRTGRPGWDALWHGSLRAYNL